MAQQKKVTDVMNAFSQKYGGMRAAEHSGVGIPLVAWLVAVLIVLAGLGVHWLVRHSFEPLDWRIITPTILVAVIVLLAV